MLLQQLEQKRLIHPPKWMTDNVHYLTTMGSQAYGCSSDDSDWDMYGFCIPPKHIVFPHLAGKILGFDKDFNTFEQWQQHHIKDPSAAVGRGREYDFQIFSIVKYMALLMDNNPNIIDSLFTPPSCVIHCTQIGNLLRDNRRTFLHKGAWHRFRGYAHSQIHKMGIKNPTGKRAEDKEQHGYDTKFGYHTVRLLLECEQILETGDINLQRDNEMLKAIRNGEYTEQQIIDFFDTKQKSLEELYAKSTLPHSPDTAKIKDLLMTCLEIHYGTVADCALIPDASLQTLREIKKLLSTIPDT